MPSATVAGFNLTPVKSTALHRPDAIDLRPEGAVGDRRFVFAREDGTRLHGISKAPLMPIVSTWDRDRERLHLRFPDGTEVEGDARAGTGDATEVYLFDRSVPAHRIDPVFVRVVHAIDPTLSIMRVASPEYGGGTRRASIVSLASVADVGARGGDRDLDARRFLMLIELDGMAPYEEDGWEGGRVRIGDAVLQVGHRVPRCVMTTLDPDTGTPNADTLGWMAGHRRHDGHVVLGVYGDVLEAGVIRVGDAVEVLELAAH